MAKNNYSKIFIAICDREIADLHQQIEIRKASQQAPATAAISYATAKDSSGKFLSDSKVLAQSIIDNMRAEQRNSKLEQQDEHVILSKGMDASSDSANNDNDLVDRLKRVMNYQAYSMKDSEFSRLLDATIEQKLKESEKRQNIQAIILAIGSLVVGWLLSIWGTPANMIQIFGKI